MLLLHQAHDSAKEDRLNQCDKTEVGSMILVEIRAWKLRRVEREEQVRLELSFQSVA